MGKNARQLRLIHLTFTSTDGTVTSEYIPKEGNVFGKWFRNRYLDLRVTLGRDNYYWHIRHMFPVAYRKVLDIQFIQHVQEAHDSVPKDKLEGQHYAWAMKLYGAELAYIETELSKDQDPNDLCSPYAVAYSKQWFREKQVTTELKLLYHGVQWPQAKAIQLEIFDVEIKKIENNIKNKKAKLKREASSK